MELVKTVDFHTEVVQRNRGCTSGTGGQSTSLRGHNVRRYLVPCDAMVMLRGEKTTNQSSITITNANTRKEDCQNRKKKAKNIPSQKMGGKARKWWAIRHDTRM